jgi:hypothetical protein
MIPEAFVTAWSARAPWPTPAQVEQDLLLSRVLIEMYQNDYLSNELVFRGGTCPHKLHLPTPRRYSEDLDFVRTTSSGIGPLTKAVTALGERLGFDVSTRISQHPKIYLRTDSFTVSTIHCFSLTAQVNAATATDTSPGLNVKTSRSSVRRSVSPCAASARPPASRKEPASGMAKKTRATST